MRELAISTGRSCYSKVWKNGTVQWQKLCGKLETTIRTKETVAEYRKMKKADKDAAKDKGGFVGDFCRAYSIQKSIDVFLADRYASANNADRYDYIPGEGMAITSLLAASYVAALSGKLSQMANGAVYADDGSIMEIHTKKLDAVEDIIEAQNGNPVLIAYWYRHNLEQLEKRLNKLGVAYGKIDGDESIHRWNNGEYPVMLIHPASASHGLNLQKGRHGIVWFSVPWSLELYQQTVDRLYRQGQQSGTVSVIHIVTKNTL